MEKNIVGFFLVKVLKDKFCNVCKSIDVDIIDSYKHHCILCRDCNSVTHFKKTGKYFLEKLFLDKILTFLPRRAYQRLFHAKKNFEPSNFYDTYINELSHVTELRKSEFSQLVDQLDKINFDPKNKKILDISGGPGYVAKKLNQQGSEVTVTEYSPDSVNKIIQEYQIDAKVFDYSHDRLNKIFKEKFDLILFRSSIIFCDHLDTLIEDSNEILNDDGYLIIETILPTLGEVLWWQQMEFKFPIIYSQEVIEKICLSNKLKLVFGYKEKLNYLKNKLRAKKGWPYLLWTVSIDLPMVMIYWFKSLFKKIPIDNSLNHKMLFAAFIKSPNTFKNYKIKSLTKAQSTHFNKIYKDFIKYL